MHPSSSTERRGGVVISTSACHAADRGSLPGPGTLLGVKTWLSTVEIVSVPDLGLWRPLGNNVIEKLSMS